MRVYVSKRKVVEPEKRKGKRPLKSKGRKPGRDVLEEIELNVGEEASVQGFPTDADGGSRKEGACQKGRGSKRKRAISAGVGDRTPKAPNRGKKLSQATQSVTPKAVLDQMAYFKEVDEFQLEEEVASGEE